MVFTVFYPYLHHKTYNLYIVKTPKKGGIGLNDSLKNICKLAKSLSNKEDVSDLTKEICY